MLDIRIIAASETYPLRHKILRQNEPIEKCVYPFDTAASTVHFGLFEKNALLAIISVFETKNEIFNDQKQFQIRGMAVLENQQKKGYGAALVRHTMAHLQKEKEYLVWFNARIIALGFYEKLGFQITGTEFEIVPIGMHFIMYKRFSLD